jgi:hypothetical protein
MNEVMQHMSEAVEKPGGQVEKEPSVLGMYLLNLNTFFFTRFWIYLYGLYIAGNLLTVNAMRSAAHRPKLEHAYYERTQFLRRNFRLFSAVFVLMAIAPIFEQVSFPLFLAAALILLYILFYKGVLFNTRDELTEALKAYVNDHQMRELKDEVRATLSHGGKGYDDAVKRVLLMAVQIAEAAYGAVYEYRNDTGGLMLRQSSERFPPHSKVPERYLERRTAFALIRGIAEEEVIAPGDGYIGMAYEIGGAVFAPDGAYDERVTNSTPGFMDIFSAMSFRFTLGRFDGVIALVNKDGDAQYTNTDFIRICAFITFLTSDQPGE